MKRVSVLCALLALVGCRAAEPSAGSFDDLRVGRIQEAGLIRSTDDDLRPMQDLINASSGVNADVFGEFGWSFEGVTEEFDPQTGVHRPFPHTRDEPVSMGRISELQTELTILASQGGAVAALIPAGLSTGASAGNADLAFTHLTLVTPSDRDFMSLSWDRRRPSVSPRLLLSSEFQLQAKRRSWLKLIVKSIDAHATYRQDIIPKVCGVPGSNECLQDGVSLFSGYREDITRQGVDAALPEQGLDFDVTQSSTLTDAQVVTGWRCLFFIRPVLAIALAAGAGSLFFDIPPGMGTGLPSPPHIPGDAFFLCAQTETRMERIMRNQLQQQAPTMQQVVDLMLNPPTTRVTLRQGVQSALALANPPNDALVSAGLQANGLPSPFANRLAMASDFIFVNVAFSADYVDGSGAAHTLVPITDSEGAFSDSAIVALSSSGSPSSPGGATTCPMGVTSCGPTLHTDASFIDIGAFQHYCDAQPFNTTTLIDARTAAACRACADGVAAAATATTYCSGSRFVNAQVQLTAASPAGTPGITLPSPLPVVASVLEGAPFVAQLFRNFLARPLPPGARYVRVARQFSRVADSPTDLNYIMDPDKDGIDSSEDNCPLTFNYTQDNTDGDGLGDACDPCPGVNNPNLPGLGEAFANGDRDGDGIPNGCDCDIDGDGCVNHGFNMANEACTPGMGEVFQGDSLAYTDARAGADFDGDGIQDQCDADLDWDGVDNPVDNCPLGDGDAVFDPTVDQNADQTDSGGPPQGDLCDPFCNSAGQPICDLPPGAYGPGAGAFPAGLPPAGGALPYLPGIPNGSCIDFGCNVGGLMRCFGDQADRCLSFANDLSLSDGLGLRSVDLSTQGLGLDAPFGSFRVSSRDLDGDGLGEFVVSSPFASVSQGGTCPIGTDCVPFSLSEAGRVLVVGSASGQVLQEIDGEAAGEHLGAAFELSGDILAIGAPGANAGDGSLRLYELGVGGVRERQRLDGGVGAGLGAALAVYSESWPPIFVASSPGAGEWVAVDPLDGVRARSDRVNGNLTRVVVARDAQHVPFVVASDPGANNGAGALFFFDAAGRATQRIEGQPGDALGSSLVADAATLGAGHVGVGAPGRNADSGAVDIYDASGQMAQSFVYWGTRVGAVLAAPGDTNGDGQAELWVGMDVNGQAATTRWIVAP